ncbi:MAG: hypothetical protein H8E89_02275 [Candidatus Nitrosopelagicus sp.]|nr:hypothetical protein [Candidatus Nitrosopelagicus sp.]
MNKMIIIGSIVIALIVISMAYGASMNPGGDEEKRSGGEIWNFRISGTEFHGKTTIMSSLGVIEEGTYEIGFVPMGDSPKKIRLIIDGVISENQRYYLDDPVKTEIFSEEFILKRSLVDTGVSKYYTWEYLGQKFVHLPKTEGETNYEITIQRSGNLEGSVSISLSKVDRSI